MKGLKDKVAIVTGARRGIGKAIAVKLAQEGAKVVVTDISKEDCEKVVSEIDDNGLALKLDVTNEDEWKSVVEKTKKEFGRVDILVNNAGILAVEEPGETKDIEKVLSVNLKGALLGINSVLPIMIEQKSGKIVSISSIASIVSWPKIPTYSATKGGISALTKCYAGYLGRYNINVNAVAPGAIQTQMLEDATGDLGVSTEQTIAMTPKGRLGKPEDIANAVAFLASEESDFITGQVLVADGGYTTL